jgi:hypothetical protein
MAKCSVKLRIEIAPLERKQTDRNGELSGGKDFSFLLFDPWDPGQRSQYSG